jgi:hypothetical protein
MPAKGISMITQLWWRQRAFCATYVAGGLILSDHIQSNCAINDLVVVLARVSLCPRGVGAEPVIPVI